VKAGPFDVALSVIIPQTPREEVSVILRTPAPRRDAARIHAAALKGLDFDALPVAAGFLSDFDLSSAAAYAMLETGEERALASLLGSVPGGDPSIQRIALTWFMSHYDSIGSKGVPMAHDAAFSLLNKPQGIATDIVELALLTLGLTGSSADVPVLETFAGSRARLPGAQRIRDASEAALARLGSVPRIDIIRTELNVAVAANSNPDVGIRLLQTLQKAGFSGRPELIPAICPHLDDPTVVDIDVYYDPKPVAVSALGAIVEKRTPLSDLTRRTVDEWKAFCRDGAR